MEQMEIFHKQNDEDGLKKIINHWLAEHKDRIEVVRVVQSESMNGAHRNVTISIFYKAK